MFSCVWCVRGCVGKTEGGLEAPKYNKGRGGAPYIALTHTHTSHKVARQDLEWKTWLCIHHWLIVDPRIVGHTRDPEGGCRGQKKCFSQILLIIIIISMRETFYLLILKLIEGHTYTHAYMALCWGGNFSILDFFFSLIDSTGGGLLCSKAVKLVAVATNELRLFFFFFFWWGAVPILINVHRPCTFFFFFFFFANGPWQWNTCFCCCWAIILEPDINQQPAKRQDKTQQLTICSHLVAARRNNNHASRIIMHHHQPHNESCSLLKKCHTLTLSVVKIKLVCNRGRKKEREKHSQSNTSGAKSLFLRSVAYWFAKKNDCNSTSA